MRTDIGLVGLGRRHPVALRSFIRFLMDEQDGSLPTELDQWSVFIEDDPATGPRYIARYTLPHVTLDKCEFSYSPGTGDDWLEV
jgi:hypothetical protein